MKCFALSMQLRPPPFFLTSTMTPYWPDYQRLKRGSATFADSAIATIIFKMRISALMKFIQHHQILGKISVFVWRIESQKRGLPHAYVLFWSDFDRQNIAAVEKVINVRYLKVSPFLDDEQMFSDFRKLINIYQIHKPSKKCSLPDQTCRFGYPQELAEHTRIVRYNSHFTRDSEESNILPQDPLLRAYFRCHHCREVIHSGSCFGYVLEYCSKNQIPAKC
jgi:hypothetical protein